MLTDQKKKVIESCLKNFNYAAAYQICMEEGIYWRFAEGTCEPSPEQLRLRSEVLLQAAIVTFYSDRKGGVATVESGGLVSTFNGKQLRLRIEKNNRAVSSTVIVDV